MRTQEVVVGAFLLVFFLNLYSEHTKLDALEGGRNDRAEGGDVRMADEITGKTSKIAGSAPIPGITSPKPKPPTSDWKEFVGYDASVGQDLQYMESRNPNRADCKEACSSISRCTGFAAWHSGCYLKSGANLESTKKVKADVTLYVLTSRAGGVTPKANQQTAKIQAKHSHTPQKGGTVKMGSPLPQPVVTEDESSWTLDLQVSLSLAIMARPQFNEYARHLIGTALGPFTGEVEPSNECYDASRDFRTDGVRLKDPVASRGGNKQECDIDCMYSNKNARDSEPPCVRKSGFSMENVGVRQAGPFDISGNTRFTSVVPVPYADWFAFGFNEPLEWPKTADALAAAYISNCGYQKRNQWVQDLPKFDVSVFSYGNCVHNRDENQEPKRAKSSQRGARKINNLKRFKFSLAFENSETEDYITEKFFGSLVAGTIPVVIGAPNAKFFAPSEHAFIHTDDFENAEQLAEYMLYLDKNDTAYLEYMTWKEHGYSDDFKALVDMMTTHSLCRRCIMTGDQTHRFKIPDPKTVYKVEGSGSATKNIFVRERGSFYYDKIELSGNGVSMEGVLRGILQNIPERPKNRYKMNDPPKKPRRVYALYTVGTKKIIISDDDLMALEDPVKLEFIYV